MYLLNVRELPADLVLVLADFVRRGGGIAWFPGEQASVQWYSEALRKPGMKLFPLPLGVLQTAASPTTDLLAQEQTPFLTPVFEQHPIFSVYNAPDSPFPETVQISRLVSAGVGLETGRRGTSGRSAYADATAQRRSGGL